MATRNPVIARAEQTYAEQKVPVGTPAPAQPGQVNGGPDTLPTGSPADLNDIYNRDVRAGGSTAAMTLHDVIMRTMLLFGVLVAVAVVAWTMSAANPGIGMGLWIVGLIGGFGLGMVNALKREVSPPLVIAYAAFEGLFLGAISYYFQSFGQAYGSDNIVATAVVSTLVVFATMLFLYSKRIIKMTSKFKKILMVAIVSYAALAFISFIVFMVKMATGNLGGQMFIFGNGPLAIIISIFAIGLASFTLCIDFDAIEQGIKYQVPERESWRMGFGLMVTLVWLYIEILRLLAIIASNK